MKIQTFFKQASLFALSGAALLLSVGTAEAGQGPQPGICTRACWGARAPNCGITQMSSLSRAIIHHTAGTGDYSTNYENSKAVMRNVQNYHMSLSGWCDIAYHFLVDAAGNIFEGRSGAWSSLPRGTHDGCNANSFGFTALGYYHPPYNQAFTSATRNSLEAVIAWRMPSAWSSYGSGTYCSASVGFLDGHYKVKSTACPGDGIIPQIGGMRDGVNTRKNGGGTPPAAPVGKAGQRMDGDFNGDGKDDVVVSYDYGNGRMGLIVMASNGSSFTSAGWYSIASGWDNAAAKWVAGDFNGDGKSDVAALFNWGNNTTVVHVFISTGTSFSNYTSWYYSGVGGYDWNAAKIVAGDFNGDGKADICTPYNYGGGRMGLIALISTGSSFVSAGWFSVASGWDDAAAKWVSGDFNGDGKSDMAALFNWGNNTIVMHVLLSTGAAFSNYSSWYYSGVNNFDWNAAKLVSGDFNGDGKSDICTPYNYGGGRMGLIVFTSTGNSFVSAGWFGINTGWDDSASKWVAGDFNGDGKTDMSSLFNWGNNTVVIHVFPSTGAAFPSYSSWYYSGVGGFDWNAAAAF